MLLEWIILLIFMSFLCDSEIKEDSLFLKNEAALIYCCLLWNKSDNKKLHFGKSMSKGVFL